jgi:glutathione S-transferase
MTITITAFERSPDRGNGLARDMRVRWALEEAGRPYEVRLLSFKAMKEPAHLALQPFGQIPTYEDGDLALFESGAIVFHIAERHGGLLPADAAARARAVAWMFAALNTVEPPVFDRLCRPGRGAARLPARLRRPVGGLHGGLARLRPLRARRCDAAKARAP